jgi:carboxyl-terminal processing protease
MKKSVFLLPLWIGFLLVTSPVVEAQNTPGVRACLYLPGVSIPAQMPAEVLVSSTPPPFPTATLPVPRGDAAATTWQLETFAGVWNAVNDHYVYRDFRGRDWQAIGSRYDSVIRQGLSDADFYGAMQTLLSELGDQHSYFQSPAEVAEDEAALSRGQNFVGIGALLLPIADGSRAAIIVVFPGSPAAEAGLLTHDTILSVDGGPIRDEHGISRTRGPEGTQTTLTVQRPGETPYEVTLTRKRVAGSLPVDYCIVPNTRIGYILLPTLLDETIDDQVRAALQQMTADGALEGLVIDNRMNGGGLGSVAQGVLSLFTGGLQGYFVTRASRDPLDIIAEDIGGSQVVPLMVLVGVDTVSYGEIVSGVLRLAGRAQIIGEPTLGNVEQLRRYDFEDGSRAWIASATFEPLGQTNGIWEDTGIIPDVLVPTRWDLFTEANDPALAQAVEMLMH